MARAAVVAGTATAVARAQRTANAESVRRERVAERGSSSAANGPAPAADAEQVVTVLKELAALKDQGILTDEEFATQKARLLG